MEDVMLFWQSGILTDQSILFSSFQLLHLSLSLFRVFSHFLSLASSINVPVCLSPRIPSLDPISKCTNPEAMTVTSRRTHQARHSSAALVAFVYTWPLGKNLANWLVPATMDEALDRRQKQRIMRKRNQRAHIPTSFKNHIVKSKKYYENPMTTNLDKLHPFPDLLASIF